LIILKDASVEKNNSGVSDALIIVLNSQFFLMDCKPQNL